MSTLWNCAAKRASGWRGLRLRQRVRSVPGEPRGGLARLQAALGCAERSEYLVRD